MLRSSLTHVAAFGALCSLASCAPPESREIDLTFPERKHMLEPDRSIEKEERVPDFRIETVAGEVIDSRRLIGKRPFMLVYFATWCDVCRYKLPMVRYVLDRYADSTEVYGVVMDDANTWHRVPEYLERYDLDFELVRAESFPRFATAYSPSRRVPAVTVVNEAGYLIEYQHGYSRRHFPRLVWALKHVNAEP